MKNKLFKILGYGFAVLIPIIVAVTVYLYVNKDNITKKLLLNINSYTTGELQIGEVEINPFVHFPNISLTINEPRYFENKFDETDSVNNQIFRFSKLHVSFDILELLNSRIEIIAISAEEGSINIIQNQDSTFNITTAFQIADSSELFIEDPSNMTDTIDGSPDFALSIKKFRLKNVDVVIDLTLKNQKQVFTINQSNASLKYVADSIECKLTSSFAIDRIGLNDNLSLENEKLITNMDFFYDRNDKEINIFRSEIEFKSAQFYADGLIDLKEDGLIDVSFEVKDEELQFTKLFLTSEGINNIKEGELFLNGNIYGKMSDQLPEVDCSFGAHQLTIQLPNSNESLKNLMIDGYFSTGTKADLSAAILKIDTLTAVLSEGYVHGSAQVNNLKTPEISYNLNASLMLENLNKIFELGPLENLKGKVTLKDEYHGIIQDENSWVDLSPEPFSLQLDSVSFNLKEIMQVDLLNGSISGNLDSLNLEKIYLKNQNSDFLLNGTLSNFSDFIYEKGKPIQADVSIISNRYDFPGFFSFLPKVAQSFPYQILNISLLASCETSYEKLSNFNQIPELNFEIHEVSGRIESFLPFAQLRGGTFSMHEIDSTSIFDFSDFDIEIEESSAEANYTLYDVPDRLDSMVIGLNTNGINPSRIFYNANDTIPDIIDAEIRGDFECHIVLPDDSLILFHTVSLVANDFHYLGQDTISAQQLQLYSNDIAFDYRSELSPFATLSATNNLHFNELVTSVFQSESLDLSVDIVNGRYTVVPHDHEQFGKNEQGKIILRPFEEPPRYQLEYNIQELPLEEFLESFYSEKLFTGTVDLKLDLVSNGRNIEEVTSNMSGIIILEGDSLILSGLNLDDLINNFRRSQSFNLVDLGAVALAGPAGVLYTKGSDYALMLTAKKGDSTTISKISSKWMLQDGNISIEDVAFATLENRVAAKGWLNMKTDSLDVTIAVVEETGCAIIDQRIYGKSEEPAYGKVKVIKTLLSPVTKLLKNMINKDCDIFYQGIVQHPMPKPKKEE